MRSKKWWIEMAGLGALVFLSVPAGGQKGHRAVRVDFADNLTIKSDGQSVNCGASGTFDYTDQFDGGCSGSLGQVTSHSHNNDDWAFRTVPDSAPSAFRSVRLDFSGADPCPLLPTDVFVPVFVHRRACQFEAQVWFPGFGRIFYLPTTQIQFELLILKHVGFWKSVYVLVSDGGVTVSHNGAENAVLANVDTINCPAILYQLADEGAAKKIQPPVATLPMCFSIALVRDGPTTQ